MSGHRLAGAGLGVRRGLLAQLLSQADLLPDFFELAPENWIGVGGKFRRDLTSLLQQRPLICHGLSLSLGGPDALDLSHVAQIKVFLTANNAALYSEHLSACTDGGHMYDLMPLPFTDDMVMHISDRIKQVQDVLGQQIAVENSSYYIPLSTELKESDFINAVLSEADCLMLLDVNNVYVNSVNHGYDARKFIAALPSKRIAYLHIAGHEQEAVDLIVDTHGRSVVDEVWSLLAYTFARHGVKPTLLERDFNFPAISDLNSELAQIRQLQSVATNSALLVKECADGVAA